jgi:hypothetical protein
MTMKLRSVFAIYLVVFASYAALMIPVGIWTDRTIDFWCSYATGDSVDSPFWLSYTASVLLSPAIIPVNVLSEIVRLCVPERIGQSEQTASAGPITSATKDFYSDVTNFMTPSAVSLQSTASPQRLTVAAVCRVIDGATPGQVREWIRRGDVSAVKFCGRGAMTRIL